MVKMKKKLIETISSPNIIFWFYLLYLAIFGVEFDPTVDAPIFALGFGKKQKKKARPTVTDVAAVKVDGDPVTSRGYAEVVDLISEGPIEGLVSGEYVFTKNDNVTGYYRSEFTHYTATGTDLNIDNQQAKDLGFLRSIYWNEIPIVDDSSFYNFSSVNVSYTIGDPTGNTPKLDSTNLPLYANMTDTDILDLSISRNIGERLYGPEVKGGDLLPTAERQAVLRGPIDKYAKTYTILNKQCSELIINIKVPSMLEQIQAGPKMYKKKRSPQPVGYGDTKARSIDYSIYYQPIFDERFSQNKTSSNAGGHYSSSNWELGKKETIQGKVDEAYIRSSRINLSETGFQDKKGFQGWNIRIVRTTPESLSSFLRHQSFVDSIVEVYGTKLRYPYSSMVYSQFDARSFSRVPSRAYDTKLLKVKVPNNYNPIIKSYGTSAGSMGTKVQGIAVGTATNSNTLNNGKTWSRLSSNATVEWNGEFNKDKVWTDNPAWCFYDLITNPIYGLGDYISPNQIDKWVLYEIAQYCDELVDDTYGGFEPRFTINHIITSREEAYKVLNDLSSVFRGICYYTNGSIFSTQDKFKSAVHSFNNTNVVDGNFTYSSSAKKARHTVAVVRYNDKRNWYQPAIEYMEDEEAVKRYGIRELETTALGCTSRGQARRFAKWIIASESQETETVSFQAGLEGAYLRPGDVVTIYDNNRNPLKYSGRTNAVTPLTVARGTVLDENQIVAAARSTVNSVVLDQSVDLEKNKKYKFSILTPTYDYSNENVGNSTELDGVRRTQIQSLAFNGSDAESITGEAGAFRSDFRVSGSGVCTKIYFNSGMILEDPAIQGADTFNADAGNVAAGYTGNQLNFVDYVITGYDNNAVTVGREVNGDRTTDSFPYSGGYFSGQNLVWSIEPLIKDDPDSINNTSSTYRIVNIKEGQGGTHDISALSYSTGKYSEVDSVSASNVSLDSDLIYFPVSQIKNFAGDLKTYFSNYPEQNYLPTSSPSNGVTQSNTNLIEVKADTAYVEGGSLNADTNYQTLLIDFSAAGFRNGINSVNATDISQPSDSVNLKRTDQQISYSISIITSGDPQILNNWTANGNPRMRYPAGGGTAQYNVGYLVDPVYYNDIRENEVKIITYEEAIADNGYFNLISDSSESEDVLEQYKRLNYETLITEAKVTYVVIYPISDMGTIGYGLMSALDLTSSTSFKSSVATLNLNQLKVLDEEGLAVGDSQSMFSIEEQEPSFQWKISAESSIYNRPEEESPIYKQYPLTLNSSQINYRITVRKPSKPDTPNAPNEHIYFEFTGYNDPAEEPSFTLTSDVNNPDVISDLRGNSAVFPASIGNTLGQKYENVGPDEKSTFYKVPSSGLVVRDSNEYPLRKFDLVVEPQDQFGTTAADNPVYANTIGSDGEKFIDSSVGEGDDNFLMGGAYDLIGVNIEPPSGMFFAIDPLPDREGSVRYLTNRNAAENNYPYLASIKLIRDSLEVGIAPVTTLAGDTTVDEETFDRFFNNIEGVVFYYTTGDNSQVFDSESNRQSSSNLAPDFKLNIKATKENGDAIAKTDENIKNNRTSQIAADGTAFDGLVTIDSSYASHQGAGDGQGNNPKPYLIYRSFYELGDGDNLERFIIPFPIGLEADNINITMGFYDTLSYNRAFVEDDDIIRFSSYTEGNNTYKVPKILQDVDINFSTLPKSSETKYTVEGASLAGDAEGAFLNSLGTPIFIPQYNLNSLAASSLSSVGWGEVTIAHTPLEALLTQAPVRIGPGGNLLNGTDKPNAEKYTNNAGDGLVPTIPLKVYHGGGEVVEELASATVGDVKKVSPKATPTMAKGIVDLNGVQCYVQVVAVNETEENEFNYKAQVYDKSDDATFSLGSIHFGRVRTFILSVPFLNQNLNPDLYSVRAEIEASMSAGDNDTGLNYLKANTLSSYEVQKREDSFLVMITQRRARIYKTDRSYIINPDFGSMDEAKRVAQAGGLRIKFAVYADLE